MLTLATLITSVCSSPSNAQQKPRTALKTLFNGTNLDGWDADRDYWRVENGAIVGEIAPGTTLSKNTWLVWKGGQVADFELRARFKLTGGEGANSGIQIRCQVENIDHVSGYQADLDMGAVWLGRIYDEHGRALLVERGELVHFAPDGSKRKEQFAPTNLYAVLFRENAWNDYRIVAVGDRIDVYVNGTLFSQLKDEQIDARDLTGSLAFQLHSGGEMRIEFREIELERLDSSDAGRLARFEFRKSAATDAETTDAESIGTESIGAGATDNTGTSLNLDLESGELNDWTATGDAFAGQPVGTDGISQRWPGQVSNKHGDYFVGGFEKVGDSGTGTLTSLAFRVTHPFASFLIGGGNSPATRVDILAIPKNGEPTVIFTAVGDNREQMRRVVADLRSWQAADIAVQLVDESKGGWGHLNFDDFRFHGEPPVPVETASVWRSTFNPLLQHLVPNSVSGDRSLPGSDTLGQMYVPAGFSVDMVSAEPNVHQPIAFTFDAKGRLWVAEGHSYPQKRRDGEGLDRLLIFSDEDGDGSFESRKVFIEGLNLVSGLEVGYGGVWVGAAPQLFFIPDRNGDDRPDSEPQVLLDGFGLADTHETLNSFQWGPDGWLYGNQGVFNTSAIGKPLAAASERLTLSAGVWRYHPTRHEFEVFAHGGSNQWGLDFDQYGQLFMTHCRSYWGQGLTTHVMQGGHYWNQVNGGYAPFISSQSLPGLPLMKNYLLASARYGHGEGGAGKAGSREVFGGHSHVGTMIYRGDNWPAEYRNHLFTLNLHGHQLNHQVNLREAGGYNTVHAGSDVLFCSDQQFIGVDLQVGPDGAVYISDWYDPRHCHNPNTEVWDRGNGRIYRMKYDANYQPVKVDYLSATDNQLVTALQHPNDWHARMAQRVLSERAARGTMSTDVRPQLITLATTDADASLRLRAVWALHTIGALDEKLTLRLLHDDSEYLRGWAIQLACEEEVSPSLAASVVQQAQSDQSLFVRRYLASAIERLPDDAAWQLAEKLAAQPENATDRDLPLLLWQKLAPLVESNLPRGLQLADATPIVQLQDYVLWYAAKTSADGREQLAQRLGSADSQHKARWLHLFAHALSGMRGLTAPVAWTSIASGLYDSNNAELRAAAETLGAAFDDTELFDRMRSDLADGKPTADAKRHALAILANDGSPANYPLFLKLMDVPELAAATLPLLRRYDSPDVAASVIERLPQWDDDTSAAAMELLSSRPAWAMHLLDAIRGGSIDKECLTAYYARQMANLGDHLLNQRLASEWGNIGQSSGQLHDEITKTTNAYKTAPLWAYESGAGTEHFKRLCAACHQPNQADERLAPKLAGTGSKGIDYIVENVIDPNAVIGRDYQARMVLTADGQAITGLVQSESNSAITLKTATSSLTISKGDINEVRISENSFMPTGLLETLNERERIELFKYLMEL